MYSIDLGDIISVSWNLVQQVLDIKFDIFGVPVSVLSVVIWSALVLAIAYVFSS